MHPSWNRVSSRASHYVSTVAAVAHCRLGIALLARCKRSPGSKACLPYQQTTMHADIACVERADIVCVELACFAASRSELVEPFLSAACLRCWSFRLPQESRARLPISERPETQTSEAPAGTRSSGLRLCVGVSLLSGYARATCSQLWRRSRAAAPCPVFLVSTAAAHRSRELGAASFSSLTSTLAWLATWGQASIFVFSQLSLR